MKQLTFGVAHTYIREGGLVRRSKWSLQTGNNPIGFHLFCLSTEVDKYNQAGYNFNVGAVRQFSRGNTKFMAVQNFSAQLIRYGFVLDRPVVADGQPHRHRIESHKLGTRNGWYVLNQRDGRIWGTYGDWTTGQTVNWNDFTDVRQTSPSLGASARCADAPVDFERVWCAAGPADPAHRYLIKKGILPFGIRQSRGQLLIPARRMDGILTGIQRITAAGEKRFYKGSKKHSAFHRIGEWEGTVWIAEGYATAASCYMATKMCTVVAFDADNLKHVGRVIRNAFPYARLVFAADDDDRGRQGAERAAEIAGASVLNPKDIITKGTT